MLDGKLWSASHPSRFAFGEIMSRSHSIWIFVRPRKVCEEGKNLWYCGEINPDLSVVWPIAQSSYYL